MKKLFTLLFALSIMLTANATLIWHESFDKEVGVLNVGSYSAADLKTNHDVWKRTIGAYSSRAVDINVAAGTLSYTGYATGAGNKIAIETLGSGNAQDLRSFQEITSGTTYASAIINLTSTTLDGDYFLCFTNGAASATGLCRIYAKKVSNTTYQLGIGKTSELKTNENFSWTTETYNINTPYLIVFSYEFVDGTKNDIAKLYVNPTASTTTPTLTANATLASDQNFVASVMIRESNYGPTGYIDEIKVATTWADLGLPTGTTPPASDKSLNITCSTADKGPVNVGDNLSWTVTVTGENLTEDVTLSTLYPTLVTITPSTLTKEAVMADGGATATVSMTALEGTNSFDVTATSGTTDNNTTLSYSAIAAVDKANIAAMKLLPVEGDLYRLTGEAIVTYKNGSNYYLQDATGAFQLSNGYDFTIDLNVGDKVQNIAVEYGGTSFGAPIFNAYSNISAISSGNTITATEVALEELNDNRATYLYMLVTIKNVAFAEGTFVSGLNATFTDEYGNVGQFKPSAEMNGAEKPAYANITGFSTSATATIIQARSAADLEEVTPTPAFTLTETTSAADLAAYNGQTLNITVERNFVAGTYNTFSFPFALTSDELDALFGTNRKVISLISAEMDDNTLVLNFSSDLSSTQAGRAYLVLPEVAVTEPWIKYGATISTEITSSNTSVVSFIPVLTPTTIEASESNLFVGAGNTLYYANVTNKMKGMRAYFKLDPSVAGAPARIGRIGNAATGLSNNKMAKKAEKCLREGRVIIRIDGQSYNLNGQLIK